MDKLFIGCCVLGSLLALQGCATTGMYSRTGFGLYSNYTEASIGRNLNENLRAGNKVGEACTRNYWGIVAVGDSSVDAAKRAGYISVISSIDYKYLNILGFYGKACTVVSGQ